MMDSSVERILLHINAVAGVTGCFVCNKNGEIVASALPGIFDQVILRAVAKAITQTFAGLAIAHRRKTADIDLVYAENRLIAKSLKDICLCMICVRSINLPLLNLTAETAARELTAALKGEVAEKPLPGREEGGPAAETVGAAFLGQLECDLARAIGPIANLVVNEKIQALGESRESFPWREANRLIEEVGGEITDEGKRTQFSGAALRALREQTKGNEA